MTFYPEPLPADEPPAQQPPTFQQAPPLHMTPPGYAAPPSYDAPTAYPPAPALPRPAAYQTPPPQTPAGARGRTVLGPDAFVLSLAMLGFDALGFVIRYRPSVTIWIIVGSGWAVASGWRAYTSRGPRPSHRRLALIGAALGVVAACLGLYLLGESLEWWATYLAWRV